MMTPRDRTLTVGKFTISDDSDCFVIAEIGHNHQGSVEKCKELFATAKLCGANAVKLQKRDNRALFTKTMYESPYDNRNSYGHTYGEHREALEFNKAQYRELQRYAAELDMFFFSTAFDIPSADFLADIDIPAFKIASGDVNNLPLIDYIAISGTVRERISLFEGGLTVVDVSGAGGTIRKKVIIPPDALASYRKSTSADALRKIAPVTLVAPVDGRRATVRIYGDDGTVVEREFDPAAIMSKAMTDQIAPLQDLLRAIYEDRGVTNSIANYAPQAGDELVDDGRKVWRVNRVISEKIVVLDCETEPTRIYVDVHDLSNYFIGKPGASAQ